MDRVINNIKRFLFGSRKKIVITILALIIVSFGIGYLVLAEDDEYAGQIEVASAFIKSYQSGTPNADGSDTPDNNDQGMDNCTENELGECKDPGYDNSLKDNVVRNFDSVRYDINYSLEINKETTEKLKEQGYESPSVYRSVFIDVFIPKDTNATLSTSVGGDQYDSIIIGDYIYAHYTINEVLAVANGSNVSNFNTFTFWINDINMSDQISAGNNATISPIIYVYESTSDTEIINSESSTIDMNTYKIGKTLVDMTNKEITVTGAADYTVNLFSGTQELDGDGNRTFAAAIVLGLENNKNRGIKGKIIPSSSNFDLQFSSDSDSSYESFENVALNSSDYTENSGFTIDGGSVTFPYLSQLTDNTQNNGDFGISDNWGISFGNIGYLEKEASYFENSDVNIKIISAKVFKFKATRTASNVSDSNIYMKAVDGSGLELANMTFIDRYGGYVGSFSSSIKLYDEVNEQISSTAQTSGMAVYNYNDTLYIDSTMSYGDLSGGETIDEFTNYIKIDSDAFSILDYNTDDYYKLEVNNKQYDLVEGETIEYITGEWNSEYFKIADQLPTNAQCPTSLSGLSKEQLMNLYGGPCIVLNSDKAKSYSADTPSSEREGNVIIVKTVLNSLNPNSKVNIKLRAKINDDTSLVNTAHQIVTNSTGKYNDTIYYLSNEINGNDTDIMSDKDNYTKTNYDFSARKVITEHNSKSKAIAGNTILISGVKVSAPDVTTYYMDSIKNVFDNFPIKWVVSSKATKNGSNPYEKAEVVVYLPEYLVFTTATVNNKPLIPVETTEETKDSIKYTKITFNISIDDISDDMITFEFYTDKAFNAPETAEQEVFVRSNFYVTNLNDSSNPYSDILSDDSRITSHKVTIYNYDDILTSGMVNPSWIEKDTPYTYTVKAFNSTSDSKMSLLYVLPYNGDISGENTGSVVTGLFSIKMSELPDGYKVYYSEKDPKTILGNDFNDSSIPGVNEWKEWTNYTTDTSNITAIKIVSDEVIKTNQYFATENGITFTITPKGNSIGDEYYNRFTIMPINNNEVSDLVTSSSSLVSVYNRKVSGFVFEDADYDGLYASNENTIADIPVEIYKLANTNEIQKDSNVLDFMSSEDIMVAETITDSQGNYLFRGLDEGFYYVKYTFNCDKYTATDKGKTSESLSNSEPINSNAVMLSDNCSAVSDIIELNNEDKIEVRNINLGLAIRKVFGVNLKKYITNVVVNSSTGTQSYDYDNETRVKIDVKNLKNTSFKVTYKFEIENSKYFPGYVGFVGESIPSGMTFDPSIKENDGWVEYGGALYYTKLSNTLIMPGEKYYFTIVLDLVTETAGDYLNLITASNFTVLGEDPFQLNFDDLNIDFGNEIIPDNEVSDDTKVETEENLQESQD